MNNDIQFIQQNIKRNQKLIGLDVSKKHLGIAITDTSLLLAFPAFTINRTKFKVDVETLHTFIKKENIFAIIMGLPLDGDGTKNNRVQAIKDFSTILQEHINLPIFYQDERFSTYFVENNNMGNNKTDVDSQAAAWFLQIFLDKYNNQKS